MRFTDEQVATMLAEYVSLNLCPSELGKRYRMSTAAAKCMLKGLTYGHVPRPPGFVYPRRRPTSRRRDMDLASWRAWQKERLQVYVNQRLTRDQFAALCDVKPCMAGRILRGESWPGVERPAGFEYPWPEHRQTMLGRKLSEEQVKAIFQLYWNSDYTPNRVAAIFGLPSNLIRDLFAGRSYREIPRPWSGKVPKRKQIQARQAKSYVARWSYRDVHTARGSRQSSSPGTGDSGQSAAESAGRD